jgi:hypothetical protein
MISIFDELVLNVLIHHIEPVLDVVFGPSWHLLDDFGPLVSNREPFFQNEDIFQQTKRIFLDLRVKEVYPTLSALLAVPGDSEAGVELVCNLGPLLGTIFSDQFNQLFIFSLDPVALLDGRLLVLVELVLALGVITARDEPCYLDPIILV